MRESDSGGAGAVGVLGDRGKLMWRENWGLHASGRETCTHLNSNANDLPS